VTGAAPGPRRLRLLGAGLGLLLLGTYGYFFTGSGPNQNTRYDLARAIVEEGSDAIDSYHENTIDKASYDGHYYSDKGPGSSLAAVPFYAVGWAAARLFAGAEEVRASLPIQERLFQWVQLGCAALPGALLGVAMLALLLRLGPGVRPGWATLAALAVALGTPLFAYSTMFYGHVLSALGLFLGFLLLFPPRGAVPRRAALLAGACFGFATLTEYPAAPAAALLVAVRLWPARGEARRAAVAGAARALGWLAVGALPFAVLLAANDRLVTGSCFTVGYANVEEVFQSFQRVGFYGVALLDPGVLLKLLVGRQRGLWLLSPVLLCALPGFAALWRLERRVAIATGAVIAYFLLLNASYSVWWGGAATYPRHLTAAAPFFVPAVYLALTSPAEWLRQATRAAAVVSAVHGLVVVATDPQALQNVAFPLGQAYRALLRGELGAELWYTPSMNGAARALSRGTNLGMHLVGARNLWSLVPLLALWGAAALVARAVLRRAEVTPPR
jgi:hypothetical protein